MGRQHKGRKSGNDVPFFLPPTVEALLGNEADALLAALRRPSPVSIRHNPAKSVRPAGDPVPWCSTGRYLEERPVFTLDPLLHAGAYYVQEAASMLLEQAVLACALPTDACVLDLCSAPGGKATHLASLLAPEALLVCNEAMRPRQAMLQENLWKWGRPDVIVTGSLPQELVPLGPSFDLIVVDAPCSGEGMFRKDPFAREQWSERLVGTCAAGQEDILDAAWDLLLPGGSLIYSTCTWEARENERQVERLLLKGGRSVPLRSEVSWGAVGTEIGLRCYPHRLRGEGFFIAAVHKPGQRPSRSERPERTGIPAADVQHWLEREAYLSAGHDGTLHALSPRWAGTAERLQAVARVLSPGIPVGVRKGGTWRPHPALALNGLLRHGAFSTLDLDRPQSLAYLRGEALSSASPAEGLRLVRHEGLALGWASGAGNRWNNGWPAPWRIRMR